MAQFSPEVRASARHQYEDTDKPIRQIALDHATSQRTINRWRDEDGWKRRSDQLRGLPAATRLLDEATALLAAQGTAKARGIHPPLEGEGRSSERSEDERGGVSGVSQSHPTPARTIVLADPPPPGEGKEKRDAAAATQTSQQAAIERIERLVEKELAIEEQARAALGPLPRPPADAERAARTLATLTQVLHALARLRGGLTPDVESYDDDDMPRDIDEFRRELARRIIAFVDSRRGDRPAEAGSDAPNVDAVR